MAFGFDDFAGLFDPISDALGTSGRQGMGLLQQEPEDIQRAAMIAALVASGVGAAAAPTAAATTVAPAGLAPTLVTPGASILAAAPAAEVAAVPGGITAVTTDLAAEEAANLAAKEAVRNSIVNSKQLTPDLLASLEPTASGIQTVAGTPDPSATQLTNLEKLKQSQIYEPNFVNNQASLRPDVYKGGNVFDYSGGDVALEKQIDLINKGPGYTDYLNDTSAKSLSKGISFEDYQLDQARRAAAEGAKLPSTVDMSLGRQSVPDYTSFSDSYHKSSITPDRFQNLEGVRSMGADSTYKVGSGDYLGEGTGEAMESALDKGMRLAGKYFDKGVDLVTEYPKTSAAAAYIAAARAGLLDQEGTDAPKDNYKNPYNMSGFRRSSPNPTAYQYTPRYAQGGIASINGYARGKKVASNAATDFTDFYDQMNARPSTAELKHGSPGIYYDADPDTRYLDPMEAAMVRMSKLNSRANVQAPTMAPARRMGELDFKPVAAAQGGIMGYADGGDVLIEEDEFNKLTGRGGGRTKAEADAKFSPTSEGAAAVSKLGQQLSAISPLVSVLAPIGGAIASAYGDHMARNVNPNYGNEAMNTSASKDLGLPSISVNDDNSVVLGLGGGSDGEASNSNPGDTGRGGGGAHLAQGGGIMGYNLGGYAAGGNPRLLRGPGDGMSDHIPATINNRQPARLADGEYVITADVVSHLGNGSTEAGARQLDAMMKRIRKGRTGTPKQGKQINPRKYLPA
jgi:hypothetical protein